MGEIDSVTLRHRGKSVTLSSKSLEKVAAGKLDFPDAPKKSRVELETDGERATSEKYVAFTRQDDPAVYRLMDDLIAAHYATELVEARIGLMWVYKVTPDQDGKVMLGKARLVSEKERQYHNHHFVIELNHAAWQEVDATKRKALLDHELCHCGAVIDDAGVPTYYLRKHDLEEFVAIYKRHGAWRKEIDEFLEAKERREPYLPLLGGLRPDDGATVGAKIDKLLGSVSASSIGDLRRRAEDADAKIDPAAKAKGGAAWARGKKSGGKRSAKAKVVRS